MSATAVTNAGSMMTALAFPLAAIGLLGASPADLAVLRVAGIVPGLALGPWLGRAVDRLPHRRVLIAAELVGAVAVGGVVGAHALGHLSIAALAAASFTLGAASFAFGVARVAIVPGLVGLPRVAEANAALRTAEAASEGVAFAAGGALVQALGAPAALGLDTLSFLGSAALLRGLPVEPGPADTARTARVAGARLAEGLRRIAADPVLRALAVAHALLGLSFSLASVVYLLFATEGLGFGAGVLGVVFAVGSLSSVAGGSLAARVIRRLGAGPSMVGGLSAYGACGLLLPLAVGAGPLSLALLALHQLGDGCYVVYDVAATGTQQVRVGREALGRVNGALRTLLAAAALLGAVLGGALGEWIGLRATLVCSALGALTGAAVLAASPARVVRP